ncbi:MAG: PAS domain S-box protein [Desulfovermiculus sp.]|nr:PAS domain S-box protein [Desulfovermiculus sp.]
MSANSNTEPEKDHESEQRINSLEECHDIVMNAPIGIFISIPEGRFLSANRTMAKMYGFSSPAELIHTVTDIGTQWYLHPEDRMEFQRRLERDGEIVNYEYQVRRRNGSVFWVSTTARAVRDDTGNVIEYQGYSTDITERKQAEEDLRYQKKLLETIINGTWDILSIKKPDFTVERYNQAGYDILGMNPQEVDGKKCFQLIGRTQQCSSCASTHALQIKQVVNIEKYVPQLNRYLDCRSTPVLDEEGNVVRLVEHLRDITELKQTEKALHEEQAMQQLLMHLAKDFINLPLENLNTALHSMLEAVGEFFRVDRVYIFEHDYSRGVTTNTHEWCAEGISSEIENLQAIPFDYFPGILEAHQKGEHVHIPDVRQISLDDPMRFVFEQQGIQSLVLFPLMNEDMCIGFVGFDSVREARSFPDSARDLFRVLAGIISNVLVRQQAEKELSEARQRLDLALQATNTGLWDWNIQTGQIVVNEQWANVLGYSLHELQPLDFQTWMGLCHLDDLAVSRDFLEKHHAGQIDVYECEIRMQHKDGSWIWILDRGKVVEWDEEGRPLHMSGTHTDINDIKRHAEQLHYLSLHDQLTGLYNRAYFENELSRLQKSREFPISIICCDVDGLKLANDTLGHQHGDMLLQSSAQTLQNCFRESDVLARVGGDEFVALLPQTDFDDGEKIVNRIRSMVQKYNQAPTEFLPLSLSIGLATATDRMTLLEETYKLADDRMYEDKLKNKDRISSQMVSTFQDSLRQQYHLSPKSTQQVEDACFQLGHQAGLSSSRLSHLALLSRVYELGMVTISEDIVRKPGPLTPDEWEVMRQHPQKGYRIATACKDLQHVADLILKHHEQWDGQGYPFGLTGEEIPLECHILAIVSAFMAMTNDRPYRKANSVPEALAELKKCSGTQFDPQLVDIFLKIMGGESSTE